MKQTEKAKLFNKSQVYAQQKKSTLSSIMPEVFILLVLMLVIVSSAIFFANFKYYQIRQSSMRPLFNNYQNEEIQDGVFVKLNSKIEVGDIIVLEHGEKTLI